MLQQLRHIRLGREALGGGGEGHVNSLTGGGGVAIASSLGLVNLTTPVIRFHIQSIKI